MIIIKLKGGLGNQLFQYAIARQLAFTNKTTFKMDVSMFSNYKLHTYSIWPLNIEENIASEEEIKVFTASPQGKIEGIVRKLLHRSPRRAKTYIQEKYFHFDQAILKLPDNIFLDGYWQSEKYFPNVKETLRKEFLVKTPAIGKNEKILKQIDSGESINIHVRRANYITNKHTNKIHGTCGINYYKKCISAIAEKVKNPYFFIFSDDPNWTKNNLKLNYPTIFVTHNDATTDYEDLRLMTHCKHHIIANSTFSWWGAWLCNNPNKIIFAPHKWFNDTSKDTKDLLPKCWIKMQE